MKLKYSELRKNILGQKNDRNGSLFSLIKR